MRGDMLLEKMELIDPAYVEAADLKPHKKRFSWISWGAAAACLALMAFAGFHFLPPDQPGQTSDLPLLSISESISSNGYEGYMAYDISELVNANPWSEASEISTLPVYQNPLVYDENFIASGADFDKMREFLLDVAGRLGLDANHLTITGSTPDEAAQQALVEKFQSTGDTVPAGYFAPTKIMAETEGIQIEVDPSMTATIIFDPAVSLPEAYHFTHFASYGDKAAAAEYLKENYGDLIGIANPKVDIYGGDYTIYNQQMYSIGFFDGSGNETDQLIHYNFNRVTFGCDDEGKLFIVRIYRPDLSAKIGDYPIIHREQAKALLLNGNYITTVPYEIPGKAFIKKVELIYRTGEHEAFFMPYYRFYIELPEEARKSGLKTYGAYYVPAVESAYISNMPVWDGSFNG